MELSRHKPEPRATRDGLWSFPQKPSRIYVAAPVTQQGRALRLAWKLRDAGFKITSRWLTHDFEQPRESLHAEHLRSVKWGEYDLEDVMSADTLVLLADELSTSGGYHVELGIFLGMRKKNILVIGNRRNVFFWTTEVRFMAISDMDQVVEFLMSEDHGKVHQYEFKL